MSGQKYISQYHCRYHYLLGGQEALIGNAVKNDVENTMDYKNRFENSQLKVEYENVKRIIEANNFQQTCRNISETERRSLDEEARRQRFYKEHVHTTAEEFSPTSATEKTIDSRHDTEPTNTIILERSSVGYRNTYQL